MWKGSTILQRHIWSGERHEPYNKFFASRRHIFTFSVRNPTDIFNMSLCLIHHQKRRVLTAVKNSMAFTCISTFTGDSGRYPILLCTPNKYIQVNTYLPNVKQLSFLKIIRKKVNKEHQGYVIMCGDFNAFLDKSLDVSNTDFWNHHRNTLQHFLSSSDLYDVCRCGHSKDFTFFHTRISQILELI